MNPEIPQTCSLYLLVTFLFGFLCGSLAMWVKARYAIAVADRLSGKERYSNWFSSMDAGTKQTLIVVPIVAICIIMIGCLIYSFHVRRLHEERELAKIMSTSGYTYSPERKAGWVKDER